MKRPSLDESLEEAGAARLKGRGVAVLRRGNKRLAAVDDAQQAGAGRRV